LAQAGVVTYSSQVAIVSGPDVSPAQN